MFFSLFLLLIGTSLSKSNSFTFISARQNKDIVLSPIGDEEAGKDLKSFADYIKEALHIKGKTSVSDLGQKNWYYVHFPVELNDEPRLSSEVKSRSIKDMTNPKNNIFLDNRQMLLKNLYSLYLSDEQLALLKDRVLVRKLDHNLKIYEDNGKIDEAKYLFISVADNFDLSESVQLILSNEVKRNINYVKRYSDTSFIVKINNSNPKTNRIIVNTLLDNFHEIRSISTYRKAIALNNLMTGYTQKNVKIAETDSSSSLKYVERYVNNNGINGEGEVVAILDTLIDINHQMFYDSATSVTFNKNLTNHRKFVYYGYSKSLNSYYESLEDQEHGTHVAGTVAGKSACTNTGMGTKLFNGNAPDSKILYAGHFNEVSILDLKKLLEQHKDTRISSNSWGYTGYNPQSNSEWTYLAELQPNNLFVFAAGNEYALGNYSVGDPGGSKNILTVGAIGSFYGENSAEMKSVVPSLNAIQVFPNIAAGPWKTGSFGKYSSTSQIQKDFVVFDMAESKTDSNICSKVDQPYVSVIIYDQPSDLNPIYQCNFEKTLGIYSTRDRASMSNYLSKSSKVTITDQTPVTMAKEVEHASYSSGGPGFNAAVKPDVVAPGTMITSASSVAGIKTPHGCRVDDNMDFAFKQGTSMATPNVAGAAALVREYFKKSNWISTTVDLDGATLRALLINCAQHPKKAKTPDNLFGHGTVDLSKILKFSGDNFGLAMTDTFSTNKQPAIKSGEHLVASITVTATTLPLTVTLSYLDVALNPDSMLLLANDVDLVVTSPSGKRFLGDHLSNNEAEHLSTNEKIIIDTPEIGAYKIHVYVGTSFEDKGQNFAVVATGNINDQKLVFSKTSECDCEASSSAICESGICKCTSTNTSVRTGNHCQIEIDVVETDKLTVGAHGVGRIMVHMADMKRIDITVPQKKAKNVYVYVDEECHSNFNDYTIGALIGSGESSIEWEKESACLQILNNLMDPIEITVAPKNVPKKDGPNLGLIIGVVVGVVAVIVIIGVVVYCVKK